MRGSAAFRTGVAPGGALAGPWVRNPLWNAARSVPSLDLRFADNKSLVDATTGQNLVTFTRASSGTYVDSQGVIRTATTNEARFDHSPTTGESLGLLVEEQRTNSVTNNTMVGAVAGTPGTIPTSWGAYVSPTGLTRTIVGSGTIKGINYIDVRFNGTPSSTGEITLYLSPAPTATLAQAWTSSVWLSLVGGSTSNIATIALRNFELNSGAYVREVGTNFVSSISSDLVRRQTITTSFGASANQILPALSLFAAAGGTPIDITLRIGMPQLEQGAFPTSVIPTTTAAVTRSADVASITGSNFGVFRTNLLLRSEEFDNASWTKTGVLAFGSGSTANATTAPNGTLTADLLTESTATNTERNCYQSGFTTTPATLSCYIKPNGRNFAGLRFYTAGNNWVRVTFTLTGSGSASAISAGSSSDYSGTSASIASVGNGWYRVSLTATRTGGISFAVVDFATSASPTLAAQSGNEFYTGDGTSGIYLWGAQLETGSTATAYIPTTTAAVTVFESSWYRQNEGTVFAQYQQYAAGGTAVNISDNTGSNFINIFTSAAANTQSSANVFTSGTNNGRIDSGGTFVANFSVKSAYGLSAGSRSLSAQGNAASTSATPATLPTVNRINIGVNQDATSGWNNGTIRRLTYFPTRLANSTLQQITQ